MWIEKSANRALWIINKISWVAGIVALVFLMIIMVLTVVDVTLRYVFNNPIPGTLEITEYLIAVGGFLGVAWCAVMRGHVKVDLIVNHLPPRVQAIVDGINAAIALIVVALVSWRGFVQASYAQSENLVSDILKIPSYPFIMTAGIGYGLLFLVLLTILAENVIKALRR